MRDSPVDFTLIEAKAAIDKRDISCREYVQALVDREARTSDLGGFVCYSPARLLEWARNLDDLPAATLQSLPLGGIPVAIKDNIDCAGMPTSAGTAALRECFPAGNAPAIELLLAAGAMPAGKTNMHELAFGCTNDNATFGPARNPYAPGRIPGGSSGGSAVVVAARSAPAALGTDTGGSVRIPAALCGVVGFRPTPGRYPGTGVAPISPTRDTIGPMARTVADVTLLDRVLSGTSHSAPPSPQRIRLAIPRSTLFSGVSPEVLAVTFDALARLEAAGIELIEVDTNRYDAFRSVDRMAIPLFEFPRAFAGYLLAAEADITLEQVVAKVGGEDVRAILAALVGPGQVSEARYRTALAARDRCRNAYAQCLKDSGADALVFPTTIAPACDIGAQTLVADTLELDIFDAYTRNTEPGSIAGVPGLSLPSGLTSSGLPVGLALDGAAHSDSHLLAVAAALEPILGAIAPPPRQIFDHPPRNATT